MAQGGYYIINYLDDHLIFGGKTGCDKGFTTLTQLLGELGFTINQDKNVRPATKVTCLGVEIDTVALYMSVPDKKLLEIKRLLSILLKEEIPVVIRLPLIHNQVCQIL